MSKTSETSGNRHPMHPHLMLGSASKSTSMPKGEMDLISLVLSSGLGTSWDHVHMALSV